MIAWGVGMVLMSPELARSSLAAAGGGLRGTRWWARLSGINARRRLDPLRGFAVAAIVAGLLFSQGLAPSPALAESSRHFPETGHSVSGDFLTFFEQYGEIEVFGYPSTDEMEEGGRPVQYFQRARMELWPENPWPYRVQLGLLAVELGKTQPGVEGQPVAGADTLYFPETRHTVAFAFKEFWERNGGLLIFGYPITEQLVEGGRIVQYFQRARFEWHPENPDRYRVQLGLLGDEYLTANGGTAGGTRTAEQEASAPTSSTFSGKIVLQSATGGILYVMKGDGGAPSLLGSGIEPSWSPDGSRIVYAQSEYPPGIYVMKADGSEKGLLYSVENARSPVWSPDGSKVSFVKWYRDWITRMVMGRPQKVLQDFWAVKIFHLTDGKVSDLPFHDANESSPQPQSFSPAWAPDSQRIVFDGIRGLYISVEDGNVSHVPNTDTRFASPAWSPDGQRLAFMFRQHDHWEIGTISPEGNGFTLLTSSPPFTAPANNVAPAWSPDGRQIAFLSDREGSWKVYVMDADGHNQRKLSDVPVSYEWANERVLSWTKD